MAIAFFMIVTKTIIQDKLNLTPTPMSLAYPYFRFGFFSFLKMSKKSANTLIQCSILFFLTIFPSKFILLNQAFTN
ncbi:hypothetical protein C7B70_05995 [Chlorogloea sp. CCALA 695]|nr:hypothetical protein C7B70_05995 [Chlorogloea sp. CCALA 695]